MDAPVPGLQSSPPPSGPQSNPAPAGDDDADDNDGSKGTPATPAQEAQMQHFIAQCRDLIYNRKNPQIIQAIMKWLKTGSPVDALANCAVLVVQRVEAAANAAGQQLDPAVLLQGGLVIVEDIADFSSQVSKAQGTPVFNDKQIKQAYLIAVDKYRVQQAQNGRTNPAAASQDLNTMKQASNSGDLDSVLPGASEAASAMKTAAPGAGAKQPQSQSSAAGVPGAAPTKGAPAPGLTQKRKRRRR